MNDKKIKITPDVIMTNTIVGKEIAADLYNLIRLFILTTACFIGAYDLTVKHLIPKTLEWLITIVITMSLLSILINGKRVIATYFGFKNSLNTSMIIEKHKITEIIMYDDTYGVVYFDNQISLSCYLVDEALEDLKNTCEAYMVDVIMSDNTRIGVGALSVNKYTI